MAAQIKNLLDQTSGLRMKSGLTGKIARGRTHSAEPSSGIATRLVSSDQLASGEHFLHFVGAVDGPDGYSSRPRGLALILNALRDSA
jgi:hypothetical protein